MESEYITIGSVPLGLIILGIFIGVPILILWSWGIAYMIKNLYNHVKHS